MHPSAAIVTRHVPATDTKPTRICVEIRDYPRRYYDRNPFDSNIETTKSAHVQAVERRIAELKLDWEIVAHTIVNDSHVFTAGQRQTKPRRFVYHYSTATRRGYPHLIHTCELYEVIDGKPLMPRGRKIDQFTGEHQIVLELMEDVKLLDELPKCTYPDGTPRRASIVELREKHGIYIERV